MEKETLGYLGPEGSFTGEAAQLYLEELANSLRPVPFDQLLELVSAFSEKRVDKAIIPIENSIEGSVTLTLDLLQERELMIIDEVVMPIRQNLLLVVGGQLEQVERILSHPQAIAQSRHFINSLPSRVEIEYTSSTAGAARRLKEEGDRELGVIGSLAAAKCYGLEVAVPSIEDNSENMTRFIILGEERRRATGQDKTSIIVSPEVDRPGLLHEILGDFASHSVNLTRIESRPTKRALGEYLFFIDFEGHIDEDRVSKALEGVRSRVTKLKLLGSYPQHKSRA